MLARSAALACTLLALSLPRVSDAEVVEPVGPARRAEAASRAQDLDLLVTKEGFVPSTLRVKSGAPVRLRVTRKVERTCVTEIVMKDFDVKRTLPLDQPVSIVIHPKAKGRHRFSCGMDMVAGVLEVE